MSRLTDLRQTVRMIPAGTGSMCPCCVYALENGDHTCDCETDVLSALDDRYWYTSGLGWEDHHEQCHVSLSEGADRDECDCETDNFHRFTCEGCGEYVVGQAHAVTIFREARRFHTFAKWS